MLEICRVLEMGRVNSMGKAVFAEVYEIVRLIPPGKVLTYGYISDMLDKRLSAQGVGWALNALSSSSSGQYNSSNVPWQRVVNVSGCFSTHKVRDGLDLSRLQRSLLVEEGVKFIIDPKDGQERIDMHECLWRPLS